MRRFFAAVAMGLAALPALAQERVTVDSALPSYTAVQGVSGSIRSIGSDTVLNLMLAWTEEFKKFYPNVTTSVEGKGSSTAPPALIEGQAQFGPMSRPMKSEEIDQFERRFGYKPTNMRAAIDALEVYVNKDNPIDSLSLEQIQQIFSVAGPNMTWDQLGVTDPAFRGKPLSLFGRNSVSGTYGYFKEHALGKRDFKPTVKEQPGSSGVVQAVAADRFAIGYSGMGYATADVKPLKIRKTARDEAVAPSAENALSGEYPLARFLYIYVNYDPKTRLDPLRAEFIRMVFSKQGHTAQRNFQANAKAIDTATQISQTVINLRT
ncbi:phosphate ABC transporter substrate-binding protein PstS family protein [Leptolyngbya sp. 15MV]|nr:phosphate ABC transporter substrate-binding protein PstS family protein [Leptolyngbya sp. 15MV]